MTKTENTLQPKFRRHGRNPWPCAHCGGPIHLAPRIGRLPWLVWLSVVLTIGWFVAASQHPWLTQPPWVGMLALPPLLALLGIRRARRTAWRCDRCGESDLARLRHAGPTSYAIGIPVYNNGTTIASVVRNAKKALPGVSVYVVDDGSTDGTDERTLAELGEDDELLRHLTNHGKGAALTTALRFALKRGHSHLLTLDADGQHLASELKTVREASECAPTALIVGHRDLSGSNVESISKVGRTIATWALRLFTGRHLSDTQSGMRVYPTAPTLSLGCSGQRFDFESEVLLRAARSGLPMRTVDIKVHYPPPEERISHFNKLWDNLRIFRSGMATLATTPLLLLGWPARLSREEPPATMLRDWTGKSRGGVLGPKLFFWTMRTFGYKFCYAALPPSTVYYMLTAPKIVRASRDFLEHVLGPPKSVLDDIRRTYRHLLKFGQCLLDRAVGLAFGPEPFTWVGEGEENVTHHVRNGHGVIFLSAHLGNYELAGTCGGSTYDFPISIVMVNVEDEAVKQVYKDAAGNHREPNIITTNGSEFPALQILRALRGGDAVAMHGDRVIDENWAWVDFFGRKAPFPTGAFAMAAAARVPVVLTLGLRDGNRHYRFIAEEPKVIDLPRGRRAEALQEYAQWYANRVQEYAREYPYQWFNLYDIWRHPAGYEPVSGVQETESRSDAASTSSTTP